MEHHSQLHKFLTIQNIFFFALLLGGTVAFVWLIGDFLLPIFWAVILAIVFYPMYHKWISIVRYKGLASLCTILSVLIIVFVPLWVVGGLVVDESISVYNRFSGVSGEAAQTNLIERTTATLGYLEVFNINQQQVQEKLTTFVQKTTSWLAGQALILGQATFSIVVSFLVMLYLLFFLLRDGPAIGTRLKKIIPLGDEREQALFTTFVIMTRSIFKGTLLIALIQGAIGGVLFWIAGIEGAILWAVVMMLLSIIPAIGPGIIWFPAGVILIVTGSVWEGVMILSGGVVLISLIDNILRPLLVGRSTKIPDAIVLISTLGGLTLFGITGFIIGPIIAGFFLSLWKIFEVDYETELEIAG